MNNKAWTISVAASVLLVVGVFATLFGSGVRLFVVQTPSMGTVAPVGTLVAVHAQPSYHLGDVVTYERNSRSYTHRIVDITDAGFITKGDINGSVDALPVKQAEIVGAVTFYGKYLGFLAQGTPWIILGWAIVYALTLLPRVRASWRWQIRFIGGSLVVSVVALWIRPWVNLIMLGDAPNPNAGVDMHLVNTGIFPVDVLGTVLCSGQDAVVNQMVTDSQGRYSVTPHLALNVGWFLLLLAICLTPMIASLFVRVDDAGADDVVEEAAHVETRTQRVRRVGGIALIMTVCVALVAIVLQWSTHAALTARITNSTNSVSMRNWFTCKNAAIGTSTARFAWALDTVTNSRVEDLKNNYDGTVTGSVSTSGSTSCPRDTPVRSLSFNGSTGGACIRQTIQISSPKQYSIEVWFQTTTKANGKLIGFGNATTAADGSYDRHLYIDSAGRLIFGTYMRSDNTQHVIVTPESFADGTWHHAVATSTTAGALALYVDGKLVGTTTISNQDTYDGYWKVGCGNLDTWQDHTTTWIGTWPRYYTGQLRFAAVYTTVLTAAQAKDHYLAGI